MSEEPGVSVPEVLRSLAESMQSSASVDALFGKPVRADGKVVIPVARVAYRLGAGYGRARTHDAGGRTEEKPAGESGDAGILAVPLGVIEVTAGETRFVPLGNARVRWIAAFLAGLVVGVLLGGRGR